MRYNIKTLLLLLLLIMGTADIHAQTARKFSIASFALDQFDLTAKDSQHRKVDGNGSLYAIIKVISTNDDDNLGEYQFSFGNMNHEVVQKNGELWVYVQRNAKMVTITRKGFTSINRYDLGLTIEEGRTYIMRLSPAPKQVLTQMVMFSVTPVDCKATIMVQLLPNGIDDVVGNTDESGAAAKPLPYGDYKYKVVAEGFYPSDGNFTLNNIDQTHEEKIVLRPRFALVTLRTNADAEIYVNGERKGVRSWTGRLNDGNYQVECRQQNHRPSSQSISVKENETRTIELAAPTPITGMLSVVSQPLGATITIDGQSQGTTPRQFSKITIGSHTIAVSKDGYEQATQNFDITEGQITSLTISMKKTTVATTAASGSGMGGFAGSDVSSGDRTFTVKGVQFVMKYVEGGTFQMGGDDEYAYNDEKPVHNVTLSSYMIGETEVTQKLWQTVMGKNPSNFKGSKKPVEQVSWDDCQEFIKNLNRLTGQQFRLPTEAEWEYAARGGNKSKGNKYAGGKSVDNVAWFKDNSSSTTYDVKTKAPNELGLYDMSGNVWEWCQDWSGSYSTDAQTNPTGPAEGSYRVYRGGSWLYSDLSCRVSRRGSSMPSNRDFSLGLRLAL